MYTPNMQSGIEAALTDVGQQLTQVASGLDLDAQPIPAMMSGREMFGHLYECYVAGLADANGQKHPWGAYVIPDEVSANPVGAAMAKRAEVVAELLARETPEATLALVNYVILHDAYHVGQLCTLRLTLDENWDNYSIYQH